MNIEKIRKNWRARDFSCDIWTDPPGQRWEDYRHDVDELFMVLKGEVELEMKGKISHLKPGEEILILANTLHSVRNLGKTTSRWLYGYKHSGYRSKS